MKKDHLAQSVMEKAHISMRVKKKNAITVKAQEMMMKVLMILK